MRIIKREWDSDFFKMKVGELFLSNVNHQTIKGCKFDLIYVKSKEDIQVNIPGFEEAYSEIQISLIKKVLSPADYDTEKISTVFNPDSKLKSELYKLAYESGKYSRFKLDKRFSLKLFQKLYKKWIDNSFNSNFAEEVLIFRSSNTIIGYVTYKFEMEIAEIGLIGVSNSHQGMGVGSQLIAAVENKMISKNIKILKVKTQFQNLEAAAFYNKVGFILEKKLYTKHYWKI